MDECALAAGFHRTASVLVGCVVTGTTRSFGFCRRVFVRCRGLGVMFSLSSGLEAMSSILVIDASELVSKKSCSLFVS